MPERIYVTAAAFCENVLEEKDGVLSLIRIVDRTTLTVTGENLPPEMPEFPASFWLVLTFRQDSSPGKRELELIGTNPSGETSSFLKMDIFFPEGQVGVNVKGEVGLVFRYPGPYWFDVYLDGDLMTRIPLEVSYQPDEVSAAEN